jgi:subtilisin family serine protease
VGAGSGTQRMIGRLAALTTLALVGSSIALPAPLAAATPNESPWLANARGSGSSAGPIRDLGLQPSDATQPSGRASVPGVVLVGYRKGTSAADRGAARRAAHAGSHRSVSRLARGVERLELDPGTSVGDAVRALQGRHGVRFAEPDYLVTPDHTPNDDLWQQGYMTNLDGPGGSHTFGSGALQAWEANQVGSRDVYVGIIDTGVDIGHHDLAPNIWTNPFETAGNGLDDDGNGYVDDVHGWDFYHDDASVYDSVAADFHGTHVAGTIGAQGANYWGGVGVNWAVTMIPLKFIDGDGSVSDAVAALDYLTDLKTEHGLNVVASNNSWGGAEESTALEDAINRGGDAGILFVASAGNEGVNTDLEVHRPSGLQCDTRFDTGDPRGYDCLISVAAIDGAGALADFSNFGATSVDIGAPGVQIASTYPGNNFAYLSGTSMAAPHVTGSLALLASCQASPTADALETSLFDHAVATPSLSGQTVTGGRVNAGDMIADCDTGGPPRVLLTTRAGGTAGGTNAWTPFWAWFSEPVTDVDMSDFTIGGTSTGWTNDEFFSFDGGSGYVVSLKATSPPAGTLSLTVPADSATGVSLTGPVSPASITTPVDLIAPTETAPSTSIKTGLSLSGSAIPLQLTWHGSDAQTGIKSYSIVYSQNGGTWTLLASGLVTTSAAVYVSPSGTMRFGIIALDWGENSSGIVAGPTFSPRLVQQTASSVSYSGTWSKGSKSSYSGGTVRYTSVGKRSATYSFSGRAVAFVTTLSGTRGVVRIKVDGVQVARIDLGKPTAYRRLVWTRTFSSVHSHKVQVVVVGGYGRVDVDAFAVLK